MYFPLATRLYMNVATNGTEYSQAVEIKPRGNVEVQVTAILLEGGTLQAHLEQGDDLQNWTDPDPSTYVNLTGVGYGVVKITGISSRWVRLRYLLQPLGNGATCILAAGIRVEELLPALPQPAAPGGAEAPVIPPSFGGGPLA